MFLTLIINGSSCMTSDIRIKPMSCGVNGRNIHSVNEVLKI